MLQGFVATLELVFKGGAADIRPSNAISVIIGLIYVFSAIKYGCQNSPSSTGIIDSC